jgi:hypothetical protein
MTEQAHRERNRTVSDSKFDENFVWYEWSFVSPEEVPHDDLDAPARREHHRSDAADQPAHRDSWDAGWA